MISIIIDNTTRLSPRIYGNAIIEYLKQRNPSKKYSIKSLDWEQKYVRVIGEAFNVGIFQQNPFFDKKIGTLKYGDYSVKDKIVIEIRDNLISENELEEIVNFIKGKEIRKK
ncbi:hypothetical protein HYW75_00235 [Candidatus Pacearchaeota archaeon]|nr:hypothetical protein [Candidatus Pacearchaeota archaeon]